MSKITGDGQLLEVLAKRAFKAEADFILKAHLDWLDEWRNETYTLAAWDFDALMDLVKKHDISIGVKELGYQNKYGFVKFIRAVTMPESISKDDDGYDENLRGPYNNRPKYPDNDPVPGQFSPSVGIDSTEQCSATSTDFSKLLKYVTDLRTLLKAAESDGFPLVELINCLAYLDRAVESSK